MDDVFDPIVEDKIINWRSVRGSKDALKALDRAVFEALDLGYAIDAVRATLELHANDNGWPEHTQREAAIEKAQKRIARAIATKYQAAIDTADDERPRVNVSKVTNTDAVDQTIGELATVSRVYQRHGLLVDFVREAVPTNDDADERALSGLPRIRPIPTPRLKEYVSQAVQFIQTRTSESGPVPVKIHPPKWAVDMIEARGEWPKIRPLRGVYAHPVLMPDGRILQEPGYDRASGLYYAGSMRIDVPDRPTLADARAAVAELLDVVSDFPMTDVGRSVWLAGLLTLLARPAIDGPTPLTSFDGNTRGVGKDKAADVIGEIALGQPMNKSDVPGSNEEMQKFLFAVGLSGCESLCFTNVKEKLGGAALEGILTTGTIQARILGASREATVPWTTVTFSTLNNGQYTSDMTRRALTARLDSPLERPELRTDFKYPDLLAHCREHRTRLLRAALTILRAYHVAGRPKVNRRVLGSFERWGEVVQAPIVWCGLPDPAVSQDMLLEHGDPERDDLEALLTAWHAAFSERRLSAAAVLNAAALNQVATDYADIRPTDSAKRKLGAALKRARGRIVNGLRLDSEPKKGEDGTLWFVTRCPT